MLMEFTRASDKKSVKVTVEYGDFNTLSDGRYFPFLVKIYEDGQLNKVYAYKGVNINVGLDDSFFQHMASSISQPAKSPGVFPVIKVLIRMLRMMAPAPM